ncbi:MAG: FAD-dependent oxidoreductase [Pseudomonadota bacterium]
MAQPGQAEPEPDGTHIAVIGGGISGLSVAFELLKNGHEVAVYCDEKQHPSASAAALAYLEPRPGTGRLRELEHAALVAWPDLAREVADISGLETGFAQVGMVRLGFAYEQDALRTLFAQHEESGFSPNWLTESDVYELTNAQPEGHLLGYVLPKIAQVEARYMCAALRAAIAALFGQVVDATRISAVQRDSKGRFVLQAGEQQFFADKIVVAAGFGALDINGLASVLPNPRPVRGVSLEFRSPVPLTRHPILKRGNLTICSFGRSVFVGATHEEGEARTEVADQVVAALSEEATELWPEIAGMERVIVRSGVRAPIGDGLLNLGRLADHPDFYYSLSHAGAGFLRAPIIARELARMILGASLTDMYIEPFFRELRTEKTTS